ncbi:TolC family protein [Proteiniphilum sp.]|uniref:TolC family protein n=1 Tax=Proteiniphilum sp. TaxID=1926877 RepID=UPI002B220781|nr:TolC family protein [Proteiniphilum sp.]MEA4916329.1 TolC family protein [Proteiniphilum sp.]
MKKKFFISNLLFLGWLTSFAQLTIEDCYTKAQANYPLIRQYDLIEKTKEYNLSNANKGYLPQVTFSAKATYQSDVTKLPVDFSQLGIQGVSVPALSKDQYNASLDVNQIIWDGGTIKSQKERLQTAAEVNKKNIEVTIYAINERINQLYFGILLADAQIRQIGLLQDELDRNYNKIASYVQNGVANQSDLDAVKVDILKAKQNEVQFINTKKAYIEILSKLIGEELSENTDFVKPIPVRPSTLTINRPELGLYDAQIQNLETKDREISASLMPRLGLFATGGYGNPGLNMLKEGFEAYYIAGVRLSWNFGNFYTQKNNRKVIQNSIQNIENQRETFLFNINLDVTQKDNHIDNYFDQLKYDDEIIALRGSVKRASEVKMANGTISASDLTRDINAEQMAIQDKILHETELLLAIYNLKFATNN